MISLGVHNLISVKFFKDERVHEPLNLSFCPMFKERHLLEKHYSLFDLLVFYFLEDSLVFGSTKHGKTAVRDCLNCGCSRFVV